MNCSIFCLILIIIFIIPLTQVVYSICSFNRLDLPFYPNYEDLRKHLLLAIENTETFEGVD